MLVWQGLVPGWVVFVGQRCISGRVMLVGESSVSCRVVSVLTSLAAPSRAQQHHGHHKHLVIIVKEELEVFS